MANKRDRKYTSAHKMAKSYLLKQATGMRRYGSLININPSALLRKNGENSPVGKKIPSKFSQRKKGRLV